CGREVFEKKSRESRMPPGRAALLDFCHAADGGEALELQSVVAGNDAVRGAGELDHALLILDVGGLVRFAERRAGLVLGEVAVEITVVGSEHEGRIAVHAAVLRGEVWRAPAYAR